MFSHCVRHQRSTDCGMGVIWDCHAHGPEWLFAPHTRIRTLFAGGEVGGWGHPDRESYSGAVLAAA
jgi:hypothetical protein